MNKEQQDMFTLSIIQLMRQLHMAPHNCVMIAVKLLDSCINTTEEVFGAKDLRAQAVVYLTDPTNYEDKAEFVIEPFVEEEAA